MKFRCGKKLLCVCCKLSRIQANFNLFKFNNGNTSNRCKICSKLIKKTPKRGHWCRSGVFIVNFQHILHLVLVFLLLILNRQIFAGIHKNHPINQFVPSLKQKVLVKFVYTHLRCYEAKTPANIKDGEPCNNSQRLKAVKYCCKRGFWGVLPTPLGIVNSFYLLQIEIVFVVERV